MSSIIKRVNGLLNRTCIIPNAPIPVHKITPFSFIISVKRSEWLEDTRIVPEMGNRQMETTKVARSAIPSNGGRIRLTNHLLEKDLLEMGRMMTPGAQQSVAKLATNSEYTGTRYPAETVSHQVHFSGSRIRSRPPYCPSEGEETSWLVGLGEAMRYLAKTLCAFSRKVRSDGSLIK